MTTKASRPGGVEIQTLRIHAGGTAIDITAVFAALVVYEDIFSTSVSGHVLLEDTHGILETLPLLCDGSETIDIEFTTHPDGARDTRFKNTYTIFNVSDYEFNETFKSAVFKLHFTSAAFLKNFTTRLNRSFGTESNQMKSDKVVRLICEKMLDIPAKRLQIDSTRFDRNFVCANWTPFQTINYLAASDILATNAEVRDKDSTFAFYEDRDGYKFVAWSTIVENKVHSKQYIKKLNYRPNLGLDNKTTKRVVDGAKIVDAYFTKSSNALENIREGMNASRAVYHDIIKKKITTVEYDYQTDFTQASNADGAMSLPINAIVSTPKESTLVLPGENFFENYYTTSRPWMQIARSRAQQLENYVIHATVVGNTAHKLASVVDCDIPSIAIQGNEAKLHKNLSGKYIVTKIKHEITAAGLFQTLELRKGSRKKG